MAHHTNLAMQTLSGLPLVICFENLLPTLHFYFAHSLKRHLEFIKLVKLMQIKGNKILHAMWKSSGFWCWALQKEWCQNIELSWCKWPWTTLQINKPSWKLERPPSLLRLAYTLFLLESMHVLVKFAQIMKDVFVCDLVAAIKVCQGDIYKMYCD